ncbi:MAG TPA: glycerol-3-phosphate 1-O-acyltransferase PlsY [Hyphomicrobium sp.]|jgi:glycerol-3-phosphate acyltransferase PlsY|uniref:glycerol-3-phosphate 1-O-acyltransferase PlsY n=1 Tax=Hyphomicrobium sp. TaxID=82 RepID=UPI002CD3A215|nr:glycerol-3-phosphate 1-O-acyltransferase PlsY [Hyphomicrobium sp.]HXE00988.1 glycerol-3-phosphate 1-O-acyltransferase PlsY [Hyphomicrobium sp.]
MEFSSSFETLAIAFGVGYLLGSIPFGLLFTRAAGLGDVRRIGSGNIGATNVLRTGRKGIAAATLLFDAAKGAVAVLVVHHYFGQGPAILAGLGAFLGHVFPVWLKFKGGKGVATYLGVLLATVWQAAAVFAAVWLAVAAATRISSLAAMVATIAAPIAVYAWGSKEFAMVAALISVIILIKHRGNIRRLMAGEEPRIGAEA